MIRWVLGMGSVLVALLATTTSATASSAVVTNGKFTNVYVYPNPDAETWEQHIARLRPQDAASFSRGSIDAFMSRLMAPAWPSYFDALFQYNDIHPPLFFGSGVASQACVNAAMRDRYNGVVQWDTVRTLANCHASGLDPSPQINLIFSPDIAIAEIRPIDRKGPEMCANSHVVGWHGWGLNTPNFSALPASTTCAPTFAQFTRTAAHEVVEMISDPGGLGQGDLPSYTRELVDQCDLKHAPTTRIEAFSVPRYWSAFDQACLPEFDPPPGSVARTWVLGERDPLIRFTGKVHSLDLPVLATFPTTDAPLTEAILVIQTGEDDLRGGKQAYDNVDADLNFKDGYQTTLNINGGRGWRNGETHAVPLALQSTPHRVSDITGITVRTGFRGGLSGDNWNVEKVALIVTFPEGSTVTNPTQPVVHTWLDASSNPLVRFTGRRHDYTVQVPLQDIGDWIGALSLQISTGNDDLRGGGSTGDNAQVEVAVASGQTVVLRNVNSGKSWEGWSTHNVDIPIPSGGLRGGDVQSVTIHTGFGGGISGDNWNVNRVRLLATMAASTPPPPQPRPRPIPPICRRLADELARLETILMDLRSGAPFVDAKPLPRRVRDSEQAVLTKQRAVDRCIDAND
jgi:hypothetical protein